MKDLVSCDFFTVPTVTFKVLFVFVILAHDRRRIVHFNITEHPTAQWTAQQIVEALPWDEATKYLLRDRDKIYGKVFGDRIRNMGLEEVLTSPRSPWRNPYVERTDRVSPRGLPGSRDRVQRKAFEENPDLILQLLSWMANPSCAGHGLSAAPVDSVCRVG